MKSFSIQLPDGWTLDRWYHKHMPNPGYSVWHTHTHYHTDTFTTTSINRQVYNPGCACLECGEPAPIEIEGFIKLLEWER